MHGPGAPGRGEMSLGRDVRQARAQGSFAGATSPKGKGQGFLGNPSLG